MDSFLEEEAAEMAAVLKSPAAQAGSALLPTLHLPFLPSHLYRPGKGGGSRRRARSPRLPLVPALPPRLPALRRPSSPAPALCPRCGRPAPLPARFSRRPPAEEAVGAPGALGAAPGPRSLRRVGGPPARQLEGGVYATRKTRADEVTDNKKHCGCR